MLTTQITQAGLNAIQDAKDQGLKVVITEIQLGSDYNYTPSSSQTALEGSIVYSSSILKFQVLNSETVQYSIDIPTNVATFQFGEIGLYTSTGILFAVGVFSELQTKNGPSSGYAGSSMSVDAQFILTSLQDSISFNYPTQTIGFIPSVGLVSELPVPSATNSNVYLVAEQDNYFRSILAYLNEDSQLWQFFNYNIPYIIQGIVTDATTDSISSDCFTPEILPYFTPNQYVIEFTGGFSGICRTLGQMTAGGMSGGMVSLNTSLTAAPSGGETFNVYGTFNYMPGMIATGNGSTFTPSASAIGTPEMPMMNLVENYSDLRNFAFMQGDMVVGGYSTYLDGGQGKFIWNSGTTDVDDNGTLIIPNFMVSMASDVTLATANGATSTFSGMVNAMRLMPGSFMVSGFTDNGRGQLVGSSGSSGTIDYATGAWTLSYSSTPANGTVITASYSYAMGSGGWQRELAENHLSAAWFGAIPNLSSDSAQVILNAVYHAQQRYMASGNSPSFNSYTVRLPAGTYSIQSQQIAIPEGVTLDGPGVLINDLSTNPEYVVTVAAGGYLGDVVVDANGNSGILSQSGSSSLRTALGKIIVESVGISSSSTNYGLSLEADNTNVDYLRITGGNTGLQVASVTNLNIKEFVSIGASLGLRTYSSQNVNIKGYIDSYTSTGAQIDSTSGGSIDLRFTGNDSLLSAAPTGSAVLIGSESSSAAPVSGMNLRITANNTGGTVVKYSYLQNCNLELNIAQGDLGSGDSYPIDYALEEGTGVANSVMVTGTVAVATSLFNGSPTNTQYDILYNGVQTSNSKSIVGNLAVSGNQSVQGLANIGLYDLGSDPLPNYSNYGLTVGWNFTNSQGEVDLLLGPQGGAGGGLNIYQINSSGEMVSTTPIFALSGSGNLAIAGNLTLTGGQLTVETLDVTGSGSVSDTLTVDTLDATSLAVSGNGTIAGNLAISGNITASAGTSGTELINYDQLTGGGFTPRFALIERNSSQDSQNWLPNSSFLYGFAGWSTPPSGLAVGTNNQNTYAVYNGTDTSVQYWNSNSISAGWIQSGSTCTLSGWIFNGTSSGSATLTVACYDSSGTQLANACVASVSSGAGWTYASATGTFPPSTSYVTIAVGFQGVSSGSNIAFSRLKFEENSVATPWSDEASAQLFQNGQFSPEFDNLQVNKALTVAGSTSLQGLTATSATLSGAVVAESSVQLNSNLTTGTNGIVIGASTSGPAGILLNAPSGYSDWLEQLMIDGTIYWHVDASGNAVATGTVSGAAGTSGNELINYTQMTNGSLAPSFGNITAATQTTTGDQTIEGTLTVDGTTSLGTTTVPNASASNNPLPLGQAFQLLEPTASETITLTALRTTVFPNVLTADATFTLEPGSIIGQEIEVFGDSSYTVTVASNATSGSPTFNYPDGSYNYSWAIPSGGQIQSIRLRWDGGNWRCTTTGQTIVAAATQDNAAVQLSQVSNVAPSQIVSAQGGGAAGATYSTSKTLDIPCNGWICAIVSFNNDTVNGLGDVSTELIINGTSVADDTPGGANAWTIAGSLAVGPGSIDVTAQYIVGSTDLAQGIFMRGLAWFIPNP